jgi:hypothetical protein
MITEKIKEHIEKYSLNVPCRKREVVYKRMYLFKYLQQMEGLSLTAIGKLFNKDHATVIHGLRTYENVKVYDDFISFTAEEFTEFPICENKRDRYTLNRTPIYWTREEYSLILETRKKQGFETNVEAIKFIINDYFRED